MSEDKFDLSLEDLRSMDAHQKRKVAETLVSFASFLFKWCDKNETDMAEFETAMKRLKRYPEPSPRGGEDV